MCLDGLVALSKISQGKDRRRWKIQPVIPYTAVAPQQIQKIDRQPHHGAWQKRDHRFYPNQSEFQLIFSVQLHFQKLPSKGRAQRAFEATKAAARAASVA